jgi:Glutathione S-transferase, N-terminal domain
LYGAAGSPFVRAGSPFVRKVQIVLSEEGLAYDHVQTILVADPPPGLSFPGITPNLRVHTPLGKFPFARIGDRCTQGRVDRHGTSRTSLPNRHRGRERVQP